MLVTPDAERTMHTLLGASVTTATVDLDAKLLNETEFSSAKAMSGTARPHARPFEAAARVKSGGGRIGFSLSDTFALNATSRIFWTCLRAILTSCWLILPKRKPFWT